MLMISGRSIEYWQLSITARSQPVYEDIRQAAQWVQFFQVLEWCRFLFHVVESWWKRCGAWLDLERCRWCTDSTGLSVLYTGSI